MNSAIFTKSAKGLILASGLIAASSVVGYAQDATVALGTSATVSLSSLYASAPSGTATLGGHAFDLSGGNLVSLGNGQTVTYTGSWNNAQSVYLLLNTMNTYLWYDQSVVGTVTLTFSDGTTQTTNLTVGGNIREWRTGAGNTVNWITDPAASTVWSGSATDGSAAAIDMLTITLSPTKTITGIAVSNTNGWGALHVDLAGLTIDPIVVAQTPSCIRPGNSCNTAAADNSQAWKWQPVLPGATNTNPHANNGNTTTSDTTNVDKTNNGHKAH
jgi:hypothetical protein